MYFHPLHCLLLLFSYNSWFLFSQQTSRVVTYTSHIQPACLVTSQTKTDDLIHDTSFVGDHENCTVLGWGLTCKYASYWKILRNTCSIVQSTQTNPGADITYLFYRSFITKLIGMILHSNKRINNEIFSSEFAWISFLQELTV